MGDGPRVLVIGGGISGLSTAHWLLSEVERESLEVDLSLVEGATRVGGTLGTETSGGFLFERGPNGFLDNAPDTLEMVRDLNLENELRGAASSAENRFLLRGGRLHALPTGPGAFLRSSLMSLRGKVRALTEPLRARANPGEEDSVASFGRRRLGPEVVKTFLDPVVTGIYAGDVERLSLAAAFPRMAEMERRYGSLLKGMKARRKARQASDDPDAATSPFAARLHSFRGGLQTLTSALRDRLGERVRLDAPVESVRPGERRFTVRLRDGGVEEFDQVVLATPAPRAASVFSARQSDLARALEAMPYAPVAVVCLGYRREDLEHWLDGYGFMIPREQGQRTLGAIWTSSIFPEHAPPGHVSLRMMVGGARDPDAVDLTARELEDLVRGEFRDVLGLRGQPVARQVYRYTRGIPQYNLGHARRMARIEEQRRRFAGLWLTGNAYRGVSMNDCIRESREVARGLVRSLRASA